MKKNGSSKILILSLLILSAAIALGAVTASKWKNYSGTGNEMNIVSKKTEETQTEEVLTEVQTEETSSAAEGSETAVPDTSASSEKVTQAETSSQAEKTTASPVTTVTEVRSQTTVPVTTVAVAVTKAPVTTAPQSATASPSYKYSYAGLNPSLADVNSAQWNLMLVNRDYILPENYTPKLAPSVTADSSSAKLDYRVAPHYNEMYLAAKADGIILTPVSGYRSYSRQQTNFENKIAYYQNQGMSKSDATLKAAERILPPGTSEHNAGLAMDIITADSTANFQNTKEYAWLEAHAADYGFILRYPSDKQNITKIIYEPWHWRYVGVDAAKAMKAGGQCLEEYLGKG